MNTLAIYIFLVIMLFIIFMCAVLKSENTFRNQCKILKAIYEHDIYVIKNKSEEDIIDFDCVEEYAQTFVRWWDWSAKRIVPKCIYIRIKRFL